MLERDAWQGTQIERIDWDEIARARRRVLGGFPHRVGPREPMFAPGDRPAARLPQLAAAQEMPQDAAHGGHRGPPALALEQDGELVFPPARILRPEAADGGDQARRPLGLADAVRAPAALTP